MHWADLVVDAPRLALLAVALVFVLAGLVKGVVGLGLPTISMALLAMLMSPAEAAALLVIPSLVTNLLQMRPLNLLPALLRRLGGMQIGVLVGTLAGAWLLGAPAGAWATLALGVALVLYALWGLSGPRVSVGPATEKWLGPLVGVLTGVVTAATGVFVIPAVPYLQALNLKRDALVQAMGISFSVSTLALAASLAMNGRYGGSEAGASLLMLLPAVLGLFAGQRLRLALSTGLFRRCFFGALLVLGAYMAIRELMAL